MWVEFSLHIDGTTHFMGCMVHEVLEMEFILKSFPDADFSYIHSN